MKYEILNDSDEVINTILATESFAESTFPGHYRLVEEPEPVTPKRRILTKLEFKRQFSMEELVAFKALTKTDATAEVFDDLLNIAGEVNLDDPLIAQGMAYLVAKEIIAQVKADEIMAGV